MCGRLQEERVDEGEAIGYLTGEERGVGEDVVAGGTAEARGEPISSSSFGRTASIQIR